MPFLPPNQQRQSTEGILTSQQAHNNERWFDAAANAQFLLFLSLKLAVLSLCYCKERQTSHPSQE